MNLTEKINEAKTEFRVGLDNLDDGPLMVVLEKAAQAAAITCSRQGAQPPTKKELNGFNAIY